MAHPTTLTLVLLWALSTVAKPSKEVALPGKWELVVESAGIASMHTAVTRFNTVVLLDRTDIGPSQLPLPKGRCRHDPNDKVLRHDCTAHSALLDPCTGILRPLRILTDTWCSSGQFLPDGTLLQTGGDLDGLRKIRSLRPSSFDDTLSDWQELNHSSLVDGRWYSTNQLLPDGSVIIVGGRASPSVEFYPAKSFGAPHFPFLVETSDAQMDNLYPYVHLLPDGHLFIFANTRAVLYDYETGDVLREYPPLKGAPRSYPSAGSSAMLAITGNGDHTQAAEVVVCGGAGRYGVFIEKARDEPAAASCGRITASDPDALWAMEDMPGGRVMGDMVMLPTGDVIIINGASAGSQGFEMATEPCLHPYLYRANEPAGLRFMVLNPTTVPRMYHSTANLLPDGRILVAGSNPHHFYKVGPGVRFPTELRVEAFSPEYLSLDRTNLRPEIVAAPERVGYGSGFELEVEMALPVVGIVEVNLASAPFSTHSFSQGQRLVKLQVSPPVELTASWGHRYRIGCTAPFSANVAPPAYYMAFAINQGVPSIATWIQVVPVPGGDLTAWR